MNPWFIAIAAYLLLGGSSSAASSPSSPSSTAKPPESIKTPSWQYPEGATWGTAWQSAREYLEQTTGI